MTNHFNLVTLFLLFITFSGIPKPAPPVVKSPVITRPAIHSIEEDKEMIPWSYTRKLTWDDFLCKPQRNSDAVASTSTTLGLAYQIVDSKLTYQVTCDFSKAKSWMSAKTPYILAHEQGHFDITEFYARKMYKALQAYQLNRKTYKRDLNKIYESIVKEKESLQEIYDSETDHSRNKKLQHEWFDKIDKMLEETQAYAAYP